VDMRARNAMHAQTVEHQRATRAELRELKHLQLLCDSYRNAQARLFSAAASPDDLPPVNPTPPPPGLHGGSPHSARACEGLVKATDHPPQSFLMVTSCWLLKTICCAFVQEMRA
jgi:hypothetical protein